jgi:hypothetical protein
MESLGGVRQASYLEVKFGFDYVHLSKPIVKKHMGSLSGLKQFKFYRGVLI